MTHNDIIKDLEETIELRFNDTEYATVRLDTLKNALVLINRQKAEIERFKNRQKPTAASGYKIENGKVVFFTNMLGGCRIEKENLEEVVETLNELLHEAYAKDEIAFTLKCKTEELKTAKAEAIKEIRDKVIWEIVNKPSKFKSKQGTIEFLNGLAHRQFEIIDIIEKAIGDNNANE